jgi:hypothetical protein
MSSDFLDDKNIFLQHASKELNEFEQKVLTTALNEVSALTALDINLSLVRNYKKCWFKREYCKELTRTRRSDAVKTAFYAMVIRQYILVKKIPLPQPTTLSRFSFYHDCSLKINNRECTDHLLGYVRALESMQALGLVGHNNKRIFMTVGALLEGSGLTYATGGAPSKSTLRRENIFETLTGQGRAQRGGCKNDGDNVDRHILNYAGRHTVIESQLAENSRTQKIKYSTSVVENNKKTGTALLMSPLSLLQPYYTNSTNAHELPKSDASQDVVTTQVAVGFDPAKTSCKSWKKRLREREENRNNHQ